MLNSRYAKYIVGSIALAAVCALIGSIAYYMETAIQTYADIASAPTAIIHIPTRPAATAKIAAPKDK